MTPYDVLKKMLDDKDYVPETPLFHPILMQFAANYIGKTYEEFMTDYRVLVESNMACLEEFGHDATGLISDPFRETAAFGADIKFSGNNSPSCEKIVKTAGDIEKLNNPDVRNEERTLDRIRAAGYYRSKLDGRIPLIGWVEGPLAEACDLSDISQVLMNLVMDPDYPGKLMEKALVTAKDFARAQVQEGCLVMGVGDAICSQIDLETYKTFVFPLHQELFSYIHEQGAYVKLHICGDITHLLPALKNTGTDILDLDWMVDMAGAHDIVGPEMILCGNLDPVSCIQELPENRVYNESVKLLDREKGKRFIFSGGCEITAKTPYNNLKAMQKACHRHESTHEPE